MDIRVDLIRHFSAGALIAVALGCVAFATHGNWLNILLTSALCGVIANLAKEYADRAHGCKWDWYDVLAGALGAAAGAGLMTLTALSL